MPSPIFSHNIKVLAAATSNFASVEVTIPGLANGCDTATYTLSKPGSNLLIVRVGVFSPLNACNMDSKSSLKLAPLRYH